MNKEIICKNCKHHYIEEISFDYPQSCCDKRKAVIEEWFNCNDFEYSNRYVEQLQQENKQLKDLIDTILNFSFLKEECPLNFSFEDNSKENKAQDVFYEDEYCENACNDDYRKCWLKYFEKMQELERGGINE